MKPYASLVCLVVAIIVAAAEPSGGDTRDRRPGVAPTPRVREVRFTGDPGFEAEALQKVLEALGRRHLAPGIRTRRPLYTAAAVNADLARLRSFYLSNGYFDAQVAVGNVTVEGPDATLTLHVRSGPKYAVRHLRIDGFGERRGEIAAANGEFAVDALCKGLLAAKRLADSDGRIDFVATLEVSNADPPAPTAADRKWVDITARVHMGSAHTVGRINFSGHRRIGDSTLRRAIALRERSVFEIDRLRRSLARLNRSSLIAPITLQDITIRRRPETATVDLTIVVRERPRGRWSLSGPVGLTGGWLQTTVSSRLPPWGRGALEASTYYVTLNLLGVSNPLVRLLPIPRKAGPPPLLILERPYVPGQSVFSGFAISPQLSARAMLANYALPHLDRAAQSALDAQTPDVSGLLVPVRSSGEDGGDNEASALICAPVTPSHRWLRRGAALAAELALGAFRPF